MFEAHEIKEFVNQFADVLTKDELQRMTESIKPNGAFGEVEHILSEAVERLQEKHLKVIFDCKWDYMFQAGSPHYDWNTDRSRFTNALKKVSKKLYTTTSHETWYDIYTSWYNYCGLFFKVVDEVPRTLSGGRCQMHTTIVEESEIPAKPTHCIAALRIRKGELHIVKQFTGTLDYCEAMQDKLIQEYGSDVYIRTFELKDED